MAHLATTWVKYSGLSSVALMRFTHVPATLRCAKQKKYESIEDYYDRIL
jgi:hypothetical protein